MNQRRISYEYIRTFLSWALIAIVIGLLCGVAGGAFALAVEHATALRDAHPELLYLLPFGGLLIVGLYRLMRLPLTIGVNEIITTTRTQEKVPVLMAPAVFIGTTLTHLLGGSSGREGAALQIGGSLGAAIGRFARPREDARRICELCGMAALFSALFGTPLTATVFVLEIIVVGRINTRALLPSMISAVLAWLTATAMGVEPEPFHLATGLATLSLTSLMQASAMGAVCALMAIAFCAVMHGVSKGLRKAFPNDFLRAFMGGVMVVAMALLLNTRDYLGGGMGIIFSALEGQSRPEAFLLKMLFTAVTMGSGFKGGEIVPSYFVGATMGCTVSALLGMPAPLCAGLGMVGVFCGVTNAPLASLLLSVELFGSEYLPLFGITTVVSFMLSGHSGLYQAQLFAHPKVGNKC